MNRAIDVTDGLMKCVYSLAPSLWTVIIRNVFFKDPRRQQTFFFRCHNKVMNLKS